MNVRTALTDPWRRAPKWALIRSLTASLFACLACAQSWSLDRNRSITQFYHTAWLAKDGAPSEITSLAQTTDGYLWIGSQRGLFQFDGLQFKLFELPPGVRFPSNSINSLMATPDGGLWISFNPSAVGFLKDNRLVLFEGARFELATFVRDLDGRIWAGTRTHLLLFDGHDWIDVGENWNFAGHRIWTMFVDRSGTLWVATDNTLSFLRRGEKVFQQTGAQLNGVPQIAQANDGRLWFSQWDRPLESMTNAGRIQETPRLLVHPIRFLFDRDGSLWMVGLPNGVCRLRFPELLGETTVSAQDPKLEWFSEREGLTANWADYVFEDREGNIWITSNKGLDRFRRSHLVPVSVPSNQRNSTLVAGNEGDLWIGSQLQSPLLHISGDRIITSTTSTRISSVYRESPSVVWWGARGGIWRQQDARFEFFPQPKRLATDWMWEVFPDDRDGGLWVVLGDFGLVHFKDGIWTFPRQPEGLPDSLPSASFHDTEGRTWLGYNDGRVAVLTASQVHVYSRDDGIDLGRIRVIRGQGKQMFIGGELGLAVFEAGRFTTIRTVGNKSFGAVTGIVEASDGTLWLNEQHGVVRISSSDVLQLAKDSHHVVSPEIYNFLDGLPGAPQVEFRCSTAIRTSDGRLWFATDNGLAWIDPVHISKNGVRPPVSITALNTDAKSYAPAGPIHLPRGTKTLRIEYTALSFTIPEKVRFKYKLQGVENDWHDAGSRRDAAYNNLGPGHYEFRVIACNNDGLWNEEGSTLDFTIAPAWFQTVWFRAFCVAASLLLVWTIYQLRLKQLERQFKLGLEARVSERTRIARDLHDTLLQSFHGVLLRFQSASNLLPTRPEEAKKKLDAAIDQASEAIAEGRGAVQGLRSSTVLPNDLAVAIKTLGDELVASGEGQQPPVFDVTVEGTPRDLSPIVRDELYRIAGEALRNAFRHAQASRIEVELYYDAHKLRLRIRDDGRGVESQVMANDGRAGHFGLHGMRERAKIIGASLELWSNTGAGTEVELTMPAAHAYDDSRVHHNPPGQHKRKLET